MSYNGTITLIIGPMFSGKTTEIQRRIRQASNEGQSSLLIKYTADTRYTIGDIVATHDGEQITSTLATQCYGSIRIVQAMELKHVEVRDEKVICIDEGQFFPDLIEFCETMANLGHSVVVSALDSDFARRPFGKICEFIPKCDMVIKLKGMCMICNLSASAFSLRIIPSLESIHIGSTESYRAVCRGCYFQNTNNLYIA